MLHSKSKVPAYRLHKASGQAIVTVATSAGQRRDFYLSGHGTPESLTEYARIVATLAAGHPVLAEAVASRQDITVNEVLLALVKWAEGHYRHPDGSPTTEQSEIGRALRPVRQLFGTTLAFEFGPRKLASVRQHMIGLGWCRGAINQHVGRIKHAFRHAVAEEQLPAYVFEALRALPGLRRGRTDAHDNEPIKPVALAHYEAVLPLLCPHLRTMATIQRWTGMRPGEVCSMTLGQIDRTGELWVYHPKIHKTAHHGRQRVVPLGPKAKTALSEFLEQRRIAEAAPLFSPAAAREERYAKMRAARKSKVQPSQKCRRKTKAQSLPKEQYLSSAYAHAIAQACKKGGIPHWHPHQLRHLRAAELRQQFGLESVRAALGHSFASMTDHYSKSADTELASQVAIAAG